MFAKLPIDKKVYKMKMSQLNRWCKGPEGLCSGPWGVVIAVLREEQNGVHTQV